ncbi:cytochrome bd oxidase small subunit CydS [Solibacillus sp. FSL H8-0538]
MKTFLIFIAPFILVVLSIIVAFYTAPLDKLVKKK